MQVSNPLNNPSKSKAHFIAYLAIFCLIAIHFYFLAIFSVNAPFGDDFYCIFDSTYKFLHLTHFSDQLRLLAEPWLEHSIAYTKLQALAIYAVLGKLDFKVFIFLGNLCLLGILYLLHQLLKQSGLKIIYTLPVAFLLLQPQSYEGLYWAGATSAYMAVIFYSLLSIYLLNKDGWLPFCGSMLAAVVALYTFGSGLLVIPIAFCTLLFRKQFQKSLVWSIFSGVLLFIFFNYFDYPDSNDSTLLKNLKETPQYVAIYLFSFLGAVANYREYPQTLSEYPVPFLFGLAVSISLLYIVLTKTIQLNTATFRRRETDLFWTFIGFLGLVTGSALTIALVRGGEEAINVFTSRYKIYSSVFTCLLYIGVLLSTSKKNWQKTFLWISLSISFLFCIFNYFYYSPKIKRTRDVLISGTFNWQNNGQWLIYSETHYFEQSANSMSKKINKPDSPYHFPKVLPNLAKQAAADTTTKIQLTIENLPNKNYWIASFQSQKHTFQKSTFLILKSEKNIFLFSTNPFPNSPKYFLNGFNIYKTGYFVNLSLKGLPPGDYRVGEFNETSNSVAFSNITLTN